MDNWRLILLIIIMTLCVVDLTMTAIYVHKYKKWQPNKPYKEIELNPVLVFLWNKLGFVIGMIVASVVILSLNFIIARDAHWILPVVILGLLIFTIFNHAKNFTLLTQLIKQYPLGHLPEQIFGTVVGNN